MSLRRSDTLRVLVSLLADELGRARKRAVPLHDMLRWSEQTTLDEDGLGADSLTKLDLVERVNEFFNLHEICSEDYLVIAPTLGDWLDVIEETLKRGVQNVSFRTSGSTDAPTVVDVPWAELNQELDQFDPIIGSVERVLAWTPPHHLYGFLFAALSPTRRDVPCVDGRGLAPSALRRSGDGDLAVATPFTWRRMLGAAGAQAPSGLRGLCSGAPCDVEIWRRFEGGGSRLIEIYGATETGGVGWRDDGAQPFRLLPHWSRGGGDVDGDRLQKEGRQAPDSAPDRLVFEGAAGFRPEGRRDHVVQVGGVNVSPAVTAKALEAHPAVAEAAARPDAADPDRRLKAFVVPKIDPLPADLRPELEAYIRDALPAPARPVTLTFGARLPRNDIGKLTDWTPN